MESLLLMAAKKGNNAYASLAPMPRKRCFHDMFGYNGKIYVVGGTTTSSLSLADLVVMDIYDVATNTWTTSGSATGFRRTGGRAFAASEEAGDRVYFAGGQDGDILTATMTSYLVDTSTVNSKPGIGAARTLFGSVFDPWLNRWWIGGGQNTVALKDVRYFNLETGTWVTASVTLPRAGVTMAAVDEDYVYWFGGNSLINYKFDKQTNQVTQLANAPRAQIYGTSIQKDRDIYLIGNTNLSDEILKYNMDQDSWTTLRGDAGRVYGAGCFLNGKCYYSGGARRLDGVTIGSSDEFLEIDVDQLLPY